MGGDGHIEQRSMVYTEYFERGTEPTAFCDMHPTRGFIGTLASILSRSEKPIPPLRVDDARIPPAPAAVMASAASSSADRVAPPPEPQKKRGFFARIFGRRGDDTKNERKTR